MFERTEYKICTENIPIDLAMSNTTLARALYPDFSSIVDIMLVGSGGGKQLVCSGLPPLFVQAKASFHIGDL